MSGILDGVEEIIDGFFDVKEIGTRPHYGHKTACLRLSGNPPDGLNGFDLIEEVFKRIETNWKNSPRRKQGKSPSRENWRYEPREHYASKSPEVQLEREIVKACSDWRNQVPTSSGLVGDHDDKVRNIDLVAKVGSGEFEFIELKVEGNTPLFAAMEILGYGVIYLVSRCHLKEMGYDKKHKGWTVLDTNGIHLKVLAPQKFYANYELEWLERLINDGLERFLGVHSEIPVRMDFRFEAFPTDFRWPSAGTKGVDLVNVMQSRRSVYPRQ